eukprot:3973007-Alexandrium_andersonii.AAC.1
MASVALAAADAEVDCVEPVGLAEVDASADPIRPTGSCLGARRPAPAPGLRVASSTFLAVA